MRQFLIAFFSCFQSFGFLYRNRLIWFLFVPFFLWISILVISVWSGITLAESLWDWIYNWLLKSEWGTILSQGGFLIRIFLKIVLWYFFWMYSRYVALTLLGPALSWLSEKTEEILMREGEKFLYNRKFSFFKSLIRSVGVNVKYALLETFFLFLLWILGIFLPFLGVLSMVMMVAVSCYFSGASVLDFVLERHTPSVSGTVRFIRNNRGLVMGIGFFYWLFFSVPFVSSFTGLVFGTVLSVTGATMAFHRLLRKAPCSE